MRVIAGDGPQGVWLPDEIPAVSHIEPYVGSDCSMNVNESFTCPIGYVLKTKDGCPSHVKCVRADDRRKEQ